MSSAAESPPGPRRASRSRGRSAAGRSRTDRRAGEWTGASPSGSSGRRPSRVPIAHLLRRGGPGGVAVSRGDERGVPGSGRRKPADFPRRPDREHDGAYAAALTRDLRDPRPTRRRARPRRAGADLDPVERRVEPDRRVQRPPGEEHPAEGDADRQQATGTRTARAGRRSRTRRRTASGRGRSRRTRRPARSPAGAPSERAQAVVAKPRKNSSSPIGARIAADTRLNSSPPDRPSPAAGSAPARGTGPRTAASASVTRAPAARARRRRAGRGAAATSGRRTPISAQRQRAGPDDQRAGPTPT